jgi:hypothetical protein
MLKPVYGIAALVLSTCVASFAFAQEPARIAGAIGAITPAQSGNWQPGPGWDRDIEVRCASQDFRYSMCRVDTGQGGDVRLVRQISKTRCVEGQTWGSNRAGVWVDRGCEGVFRVQRRWTQGPGHGGPGHGGPGHGGWQPGPGWETAIRLRCASQDFRYNLCRVDTGRGGDVRIERQISKTRCVEGRTWGWNRAGVWVDGGCEASFIVDRRWR